MKNTLTNFIPLIRFLNVFPDDFYDKVRPYEQIIPKKIYEQAMTYYLVEQPKLLNHIIKSNIIEPKLAIIIANWIVGNDSNVFFIY